MSEGNVLQPVVVGRAIDVHPLAILLGVTAGATLAGITGRDDASPLVAAAAIGSRVVRYVIDPSWLEGIRPPHRPLLLFDGGCPFCRATARVVARLDPAERLAMLDRDDEAAAPFVARIPGEDVQASWQLIEPSGVRLMHGPAVIRVLEYLPATHFLAPVLRRRRVVSSATAMNRLLGRIRKPLAPFFPDQRRPRRCHSRSERPLRPSPTKHLARAGAIQPRRAAHAQRSSSTLAAFPRAESPISRTNGRSDRSSTGSSNMTGLPETRRLRRCPGRVCTRQGAGVWARRRHPSSQRL